MRLKLEDPVIEFKQAEATIIRDWLTSTEGSAWQASNAQGAVIKRFKDLLDKAAGANGS